MSYRVVVCEACEKELKHLAKKYPSIKADLAKLLNQLMVQPLTGVPLGNNCFKIRLSISSKGRGKSGGARVITFVLKADECIYILSVYDKSEAENITDAEITKRLGRL